MRDDFSEETKRVLAERVNYRCSRCRAGTAGPRKDEQKSLNVGVAAHITAAAPGGPRYDPDLTPEQRRHSSNAIWLCQNCAKLIDNDTSRFTVAAIRDWKSKAEALALAEVGRPRPPSGDDQPPSNEELDLLLGAGEQGALFVIRPGNGPAFISGAGVAFPTDPDEETSAQYQEALESLCLRRLAHYEPGSRYQLTAAGFRYARALRAALEEPHDTPTA